MGVAARIETHAAGAADGRLHVGLGKVRTLAGQPVQVWSVYNRVAGQAKAIRAHLVDHNEQNVFYARHGTPFHSLGAELEPAEFLM